MKPLPMLTAKAAALARKGTTLKTKHGTNGDKEDKCFPEKHCFVLTLIFDESLRQVLTLSGTSVQTGRCPSVDFLLAINSGRNPDVFRPSKLSSFAHHGSSSSELLTTAKEASMLARANILYSPFRNGLKLCQIRMCFLLSMTCAAFFFLVTTDPFSNINVHYVKRQAGDSYKKAIAQLQSLRPLLPEVKVVQRQYGKAHSFKKSAVGTGCVRPTQNINDTEIMALIRSVAPLKCASQPNWIEARNGRVILKEDAVSRNGTVRCELQPFEFVDDFTARALNRSVVRYNTTVPTDFFKIECTAADGKRYTNYHATTVAKETLNQKLERVVGFDRPLNIYICGFDSVSRMTFMRKLKETYKHITQVLNGTVLEMYNIVGDGTPAAL
ncbi:hypothetical protein M514_27206, partial [Trichuris suis]